MEWLKLKNVFIVVLLGFVIFTIFTAEIGYEGFVSLLNKVSKPLVVIVIFLNVLNLIAFTLSWKYLIPVEFSTYKLFKFYMAGTFINNVTPSFGTGGEPLKALLLGKYTGISKAECFAGVVSQRMLNMFPFLLIGLMGTGLLFYRPELRLNMVEILALVFSIGIGFLAFGLLVYFYMRKDKLSLFIHSTIKFFAPFVGFVKKGFDHRSYASAVDDSINSFHGGLKNVRHNKNGLLYAAAFSFIGWGFDIMAIYTVFLSLGAESYIHISVLIIAYTISMISGWLPLFLPGGVGVVDGTMATLFIFGGVPFEIALFATLIYRLTSYWFNTILGAVCLWSSFKN